MTFTPGHKNSGIKALELPSAISRNNFSTITKEGDSTDASFTRHLPKSIEKRKDSLNVVIREDPMRPQSLPRS